MRTMDRLGLSEGFGRGYKHAEDLVDFSAYDVRKCPASWVVASTEVISSLVPVPIDVPEPAMAMEEARISALRRAESVADAPVLTPQDPAV
jgi:hypothetical protein